MDTNTLVIFGLGSRGMYQDPDKLKFHGLGMEFVKHLSLTVFVGSSWQVFENFACYQVAYEGLNVYLVINLTSVNYSGLALDAFLKQMCLRPKPEQVIICHDSLDLPSFGVKLSDRALVEESHRGVIPLLQLMQSTDCPRLKFGPPEAKWSLDAHVELVGYSGVFADASKKLFALIHELAKARERHLQLETACQAGASLVKTHTADWANLVAGLNPDARSITASIPPALAVVTETQANHLLMATRELYKAIARIAALLLRDPGSELATEMRRFVPDPIWFLGIANRLGLKANFLNLDFHASGPTTIGATLIEGNTTAGGIQDYPGMEDLCLPYLESLGLRLMQPAECRGVSAIVKYAIKPYVTNGAVAIIDSKRDDGIDRLIFKECQAQNIVF